MMSRNQETLRIYASEPFMHDPTLREMLGGIAVPSLVAWGASDRIVSVDYGRRLASSIPGAGFETIEDAGHFPQIEKLDVTVGLVAAFVRNTDAQSGQFESHDLIKHYRVGNLHLHYKPERAANPHQRFSQQANGGPSCRWSSQKVVLEEPNPTGKSR